MQWDGNWAKAAKEWKRIVCGDGCEAWNLDKRTRNLLDNEFWFSLESWSSRNPCISDDSKPMQLLIHDSIVSKLFAFPENTMQLIR